MLATVGAGILSRVRFSRESNVMPRYVANENLPYFCTITVLDWLPVRIEARHVDPIIDSLRFCRERKGLRVHAFVVAPNHLHLICSVEEVRARKDSRASGRDARKDSAARTVEARRSPEVIS